VFSLMCLSTSSYSQQINLISPSIVSIYAPYGPRGIVRQPVFGRNDVKPFLSEGQDLLLEL